jgi:hypothetical protein
VPKRRRNEDGSLVVPLSPAQQASLAKGRDALASKYGRAGEGERPAGQGERRRQGERAAGQGERRSSSVEVVKLSKGSGGRTKASTRTKASGAPAKAKKTGSSRSRSSSSGTTAARATSSAKESRGLLDRFADSLRST